ncbi:LuxR C-terminal-related transcriptional regulator [Trabulsiella odontotermitis]|uniref:LuxR C-terminal-related transcriptional regulator n=1 Tax=Trabulsiella odontotermitis TaxID=379893 RepID=UPI001EDCFA3E|nr:LuxR C-terminal-related transcriptional regulator [Trabulsiella odontotermitis]
MYAASNDYSQLMALMRDNSSHERHLWLFCDLDSLPRERFHALHLMKGFCQHKNKKLIILLNEHNMPLFITLYSLLPDAHWLHKHESLEYARRFFQDLLHKQHNGNCFSDSLTQYTHNRLRNHTDDAISGNEWWLMEEIIKGKSLSQISSEVNVDVRRLSYIKRHLMKRLNIRNNIDLFAAIKGIIP